MELYITDYNGTYNGKDDLVHYMDCGWGFDDVIISHFNVEEVELEWDDDIDLNYEGVQQEVYDKYFKNIE